MKMNVGKRVLMFAHWLFSLLVCAAFVTHILKPEFTTEVYSGLEQATSHTHTLIIGAAILALYLVLTIVQIGVIFHRDGRRADRGFITVDSSDTDRVRISIPAIEQMVRQAVYNVEGLTDLKISIENKDDTVAIGVNASILNGSHVPTITMNMQHAIRQFVEMNCGVAVCSVSVNINAVTIPGEVPQKKKRSHKEAFTPAVVSEPVEQNRPMSVAVAPVDTVVPMAADLLEIQPEPIVFSEEPESTIEYAPEVSEIADEIILLEPEEPEKVEG